MCGIIAIVRRRATRSVPSSTEVLSGLPALLASLPADAAALGHLADQYEALNAMLSGVPGVTCLMSDAALIANLTHHTDALEAGIAELELLLEAGVAGMQRLGARAATIRAVIGPVIGPDSYEVGPEFPAPFLAHDAAAEFFFRPALRDGHHLFNLPGYVARRLEALGLAEVAWLGHDTYAGETEFFSYRRNSQRGDQDYGRLLAAIALAD